MFTRHLLLFYKADFSVQQENEGNTRPLGFQNLPFGVAVSTDILKSETTFSGLRHLDCTTYTLFHLSEENPPERILRKDGETMNDEGSIEVIPPTSS